MTPSVVLLTIGRSGSTVVARMLESLGWSLPDCDEYAEHVTARRLNDVSIRNGHFATAAAEKIAASLAEHRPWVLKDPRLVLTLDDWQPLLDDGRTALVWLRREATAVERSLRAQGWGRESSRGWLLRGWTIGDLESRCRAHVSTWNGPTVEIDYERVRAAVSLFDLARGR